MFCSGHLQRRLPPVWETALSVELSCFCWGEMALAPSAQFVCLNPTRAGLRQKAVYLSTKKLIKMQS